MEASARVRSSPVSPKSASVKMLHAGSWQVRSLNSSRAVAPISALASSIPLFTLNKATWPISEAIATTARPCISALTVFDRTVNVLSSLNSILKSSYPASANKAGRTAAASTAGTGASGPGSASTISVTEPVAPGSCTMIRSSPNNWMIGSSVPNRSTRRLILSKTPCICSRVGSSITLDWKRVIAPRASVRASFRPVRLGSSSAKMSVRIRNRFTPVDPTCSPSNSASSSPNRSSCSVVISSLIATSSVKVISNLVPVSAW